MKRTTVTLPDDVAVLLEREAKRKATSASEITREALTEYLGLSDQPKKLGFIGLGRSSHHDIGERFEEYLAAEYDRDHDCDR